MYFVPKNLLSYIFIALRLSLDTTTNQQLFSTKQTHLRFNDSTSVIYINLICMFVNKIWMNFARM